jgi:small subunit ribosomal protein S17
MADETDKTTEEVPEIEVASEGAEVPGAGDSDAAEEIPAIEAAEAEAVEDATDDVVTEGGEAPAVPAAETPAAAGDNADAEASEGGEAPAPPITTAKTPSQRRAERQAARHSAASAQTERTPEARQAERDAERGQKAVARSRRRGQERAKYQASEHERVPTPPRDHVAGIQKTRQGIVVSDKAAKTITVRIDDARPHRKYRKIVRTSTTVHAHDESNDANIGDTVVVQESRPLSATKRWRLIEIVERAR